MKRRTFPSGAYDINWKIIKDAKWGPFKSYQCVINEEEAFFILKNAQCHILYQYIHADAQSVLLNFDDFFREVNTIDRKISGFERCMKTVIINFPCSYFSQQQLLSLPPDIRYLRLSCDYNNFYGTVEKIDLIEWEFRHDIKLINWQFEKNECECEDYELDGRFIMNFIVNETLYKASIGNLELSTLLQSASIIPNYIQLSIDNYNHVWIEVDKETKKIFIGDYFRNYFTKQNAIDFCYHVWKNCNWSNSGVVKQKQLEYKYKET